MFCSATVVKQLPSFLDEPCSSLGGFVVVFSLCSVLQPIHCWQSCEKWAALLKRMLLCVFYTSMYFKYSSCVCLDRKLLFQRMFHCSQWFTNFQSALLLKCPNVQKHNISIILAQLTDTVENPGQLDICYHDPVVIVSMDKHIQLNKDLNLASRQYSCYHLIWCILNCWYCIYFLVTKYGAHANILCLLVRHVKLSYQTLQRRNGRCSVSIAPRATILAAPHTSLAQG